MTDFRLTPQLVQQYQRDGYLIIRNFLSKPRIDKLYGIATVDEALRNHAYEMPSVMIAITAATQANGCLQVIGGSHKMGRIEHGFAGEQMGASQHYVDLALKTLPLVYVELEPGDALLFHSNLLHRSAPNNSNRARWSLISVYNRQTNTGYNEPNGGATVAVNTVPDEALLDWATTGITGKAGFLEKDKDEALK